MSNQIKIAYLCTCVQLFAINQVKQFINICDCFDLRRWPANCWRLLPNFPSKRRSHKFSATSEVIRRSRYKIMSCAEVDKSSTEKNAVL